MWFWGRRALGAFQRCCRGTECGNSPGKKEPVADQGCQALPTCLHSGFGRHGGRAPRLTAWGQQARVWFLWLRQLVSTPCTPMYLPSPLLPPHLFLIRLFHCKPTQAPEPHCPGYRWEGLCFHKLHPSPQRCSDAQHSVRTVVQPPGLDSRLPSDQCPWWP